MAQTQTGIAMNFCQSYLRDPASEKRKSASKLEKGLPANSPSDKTWV